MEAHLELQTIYENLDDNKIQYLINLLKQDGYLNKTRYIKRTSSSIGGEIYFEALKILEAKYELLSIEQERTILNIAKKL